MKLGLFSCFHGDSDVRNPPQKKKRFLVLFSPTNCSTFLLSELVDGSSVPGRTYRPSRS